MKLLEIFGDSKILSPHCEANKGEIKGAFNDAAAQTVRSAPPLLRRRSSHQ